MPRVREFDPDVALEKAIKLFWRKGYAETSMRDLVEFTGVAHAGLYSAFGSKRNVFKAALAHYRDTTMTQFLQPLESSTSGRAEVEGFFDGILQLIGGGHFENGCFMVNTGIEFGDEAGDILTLVADHMERMVMAFRAALGRAKARGEVPDSLDPETTAEFLVSVFNGIAVFARARSPFSRIEHSVQVALKELG